MRRPALLRRLALSTTALAFIGGGSGAGQAASCTWNGGNGDWSNAAFWDCGVVPGASDVVRIDAKPGTVSFVTISNSGQSASTVTLDSGDTLSITNGSLGVGGGSFVNNGTIALNSSSQLIGTGGNLMLTGSGIITLSDTGNGGAYLYAQNGNQLTIGSNQFVSGTGYVGNDQGVVTNAGVIAATSTQGPPGLVLNSQGGSGGIGAGNGVGAGGTSTFLNTGMLEATGGGLLRFQSGTYENQGAGTILATGHDAADNASIVSLENDIRLIGGTLTTTDGGVISAINNGTQFLQGVTLSSGSNLTIISDTVRIDNTLTNNGTITIGSSGQLVGETATSAITGTGTIVLNDTGNGGAYLYDYNGTQMTIGSGQTVMGTGYVSVNQGVLTNNGIIDATSTQGPPGLVIDAQGGSGGIGANNGVGTGGNAAFLNTNLLEATGGGLLHLVSGLYENQGNGRILATGAGSTVLLDNDVRIVSGTLNSTNGGIVTAANGTQYLQDVALTSGSNLSYSNDTVRIDNTLTNNGTITMDTGGVLVGETAKSAITGTGTIVLNDTGNGAVYLYDYNGTQMTIGSGQTVMGTGYVSANQGVLTNNGIIDATSTQGPPGLVIDAQGGSNGIGANNGVGTNGNTAFLNNNLLEATGGGLLHLVSGLYENSATAQISAIGTGSTVLLDNDVRILGGTISSSGGGTVVAANGTQYLQDTTLGTGSNLGYSNDTVRIDNTLTNNGTITIGTGGVLVGETAASATQPGGSTLAGTGTVVLNDAGNAYLYAFNGSQLTVGNGQLIFGSGQIGLNQGVIDNRGNILSNGAITIDAQGGSGGIGAGNGLGSGSNVAFYNDNGGQVQANNGGTTLTLVSGLYEQAAGGSFSAGAGSSFYMDNDSNLANLQSDGVLNKGLYFAFANGAMTLRSNQTSAITTIGTNNPGTDTIVTLSGTGSVIQVTPSGGGAVTTIDQSLQSIAQSGELVLSNGRSFTAASGGFTNAGTLALDSGATFTATGLANSGLVTGNGTLAAPITNSGSVVANGGTLNSLAITGTTGAIQSNTGATLSLADAGASSTAGFLVNNGALALGDNNVTVTSDYQNAGFGSGSAFNVRANVAGSGLILAASATQDLSGPGLSGSTLNVGNVRLGNSSSTTLTITNNGTLTTLRGAVESPSSNTVNISSSNFVVGPNGGKTTVTLSYTGTQAGSLQGQTITVANNFDNVADQRLQITGAAYNPASASLSPNPVQLGATRVGGTLSGNVSITNTAPAGQYSESLAVTGATGSGGATGTTPAGLIGAGASAVSTVMLDTQTSGTKSGSVTYALVTDGTGTSDLAQAALPSQTVTVTGKVYQIADPRLASTNVTFATVRQGSTPIPTAMLAVTNSANGQLNDSLVTSVNSTPSGIAATAPGALAGGQSGNVVFTESTATAGVFSGTSQLGFSSNDSDLGTLALPGQSVTVGGTVTQLAVAQLLKNAGSGTFSGSGTTYTLDFGNIMAGAGAVNANLAVLNAIMNSAYGETLGGTFGSSGGTGYSFAGMTFAGLAGGSEDTGNILTFDYSGLGDGAYTDILTLNDYSSYAGLSDMALAPIRVNVTAQIFGAGGTAPGAVPEPGSWAMIIAGFGALGVSLRRRRRMVEATA
ncbi:beta strand repeat-containing protein [Sphingomonas bacterium]|uniref:beta strand repeat-containing protein n=1 Tax=Sphingomonas bacterium TaxID=1895847 RepID=UPI0015769C10|nr:choice-of-anchor D domain-containing protein [Sphingomonas bacterium]